MATYKIILSIILALIVILSYSTIRDINNSEMITSRKRKWVLFILYFPVFGALFYIYKKEKKELIKNCE
ncbi:MAG: hypothetical protein HC854_02055 [Flavobacterium sp.]|nr:hypothetical protein [Flavobacterium sp.]